MLAADDKKPKPRRPVKDMNEAELETHRQEWMQFYRDNFTVAQLRAPAPQGPAKDLNDKLAPAYKFQGQRADGTHHRSFSDAKSTELISFCANAQIRLAIDGEYKPPVVAPQPQFDLDAPKLDVLARSLVAIRAVHILFYQPNRDDLRELYYSAKHLYARATLDAHMTGVNFPVWQQLADLVNDQRVTCEGISCAWLVVEGL